MAFKSSGPIKTSKKFLDNGGEVMGLVYNRKTTKYGVKGVDIDVKLFRNEVIYRMASETAAQWWGDSFESQLFTYLDRKVALKDEEEHRCKVASALIANDFHDTDFAIQYLLIFGIVKRVGWELQYVSVDMGEKNESVLETR